MNERSSQPAAVPPPPLPGGGSVPTAPQSAYAAAGSASPSQPVQYNSNQYASAQQRPAQYGTEQHSPAQYNVSRYGSAGQYPAAAQYQASQYADNQYGAASQYHAAMQAAAQQAAQRAARRRGIKTTVNRASRFALIYMIVFMGAYLLCQLALEAIAKHLVDTGGAAGIDHALALSAIIDAEGLLYLFAVAVGVIVLMLMRGGMVCSASLWLGERGRDGRRTGRLMKPAWLVVFFALVIGVQGVLEVTQIVLAMFGIRFVSLTDGAQGLAGAVLAGGGPLGAWHAGLGGPVDPNYFSPVGSFFVGGTCYAWFLAPIVEEIVFRGVVMGTLKPLGRKFAILTSAIMFGLFHDDLVQGLFAFGLGLILGFVAMEYSLLWSIALHMFNNAVLSGLFIDVFASSLGDDAVVVCMLLLTVVGIIGLIVVFTRFGSGLRRYSRKHRTAAGTYGAAWTSGWFVAFVVVNVALTVAFAVLTAMGS